MAIRLVLADDVQMVRAGLRMLLSAEPDIEVVAEAADGHGAIAAVEALAPDVVLMDLSMPGMDGIEATSRIVAERPNRADQLTRVLVLTSMNDEENLYGALRAGAHGYMLKHSSPDELADAVRRVASGDSWLDPAVIGRVVEALRLPSRRDGGREVARVLTPREQEVFRLVADGLSNDDIRRRLVLSEATVKTHVARILMKTGSRDRAAAVALAYRSGFVRTA
jgi:DNA-binding NarL/FixJ family response regulator